MFAIWTSKCCVHLLRQELVLLWEDVWEAGLEEESGPCRALGHSLPIPSGSVFLQTTDLPWKKISKETRVAIWSGFWCVSCR